MEFDNIPLAALNGFLTEETTLQRFYPLIAEKGRLVVTLTEWGVCDADALRAADLAELAARAGLPEETLRGLRAFFDFYRFRPRPLRELAPLEGEFVEALRADGLRNSGDYLRAYRTAGGPALAARYGFAPGAVRRFACLCDLMRLSGVLLTRATLYYESGIHTLADFAARSRAEIGAAVAEVAARSAKAPPLPKELASTIALAGALPKIL